LAAADTGPAAWGGTDLNARFAGAMGQLLGPDFPRDLGLAVSGGGDSMAMLHLARAWARPMGVQLWVVTVDHGLRAESAAEAAMVARECADLGLPHCTLRWQDRDGTGNLQAAARAARLRLISGWRGRVRHVCFAHTEDDQAETVLMRLARGSGVEGLSGMRSARRVADVPGGACPPGEGVPPPAAPGETGWTLLRPLLGTTRAELRHYAKVLHIPYADDPSNDDPGYDRVKARQALAALAPLGLDARRLSATAEAMARARLALEARAREAARDIVRYEAMHLIFDRDGMAVLDADTALRLFAAALQWTTGAAYRPRLASLERTLDEALAGRSATLMGCQVTVTKTRLHIAREPRTVAGLEQDASCTEARWDNRWAFSGPIPTGATVCALGPEGLAQIERPAALPAAVLHAMPAIWQGKTVISVPGLWGLPIHAEPVPKPQDFPFAD
jgi:tRNA(Ile)-lysidine synthase